MWEEQKTETETKPKGFSASAFESQISCLDRGPVLWCFIIQKISVNELFDKNLSFVHEMSDCLWKFPFLLHFLLSFEEIELFQIKNEDDHMEIQQNVAPIDPIDPLEIAFRTALDNVRFLGGEVGRLRFLLHTMPINCEFERLFYQELSNFTSHYHGLWCNELTRTNTEYMRSILTI